tara:strand:+ start:2258 stop:3388 length:1131 start_codon:yes stop_codon:yes gene_type:complete
MKHKFVHIVNDLRKGGTNNCFVNLIKSTSKNSTIICINKKEFYYEYLISRGFSVYYLDFSSVINFVKSFYKIIKVLKKEQTSVFNCWLYKSCLFGGLISIIFRNKKIIWNIRHADTEFKVENAKKHLLIRLCSIISNLKKINIIYNSYCAMKSHRKIGFKSNNYQIINNSFDSIKFQNSKNKKKFLSKYNINNDKLIISMYGRYHPIKNHYILLQSIAKISRSIPNIHLFLAGRGISNKNVRLTRTIESFSLQNITTLAGYLEDQDLIDAYSSTDITVLTSRSESFPNVIGESMACMTPCVSFNVGDCKYIIGNTGWVTRKNSLKELIYTLEKAVKISRKENKWQKIKIDCSKRIKDVFNYEKEIKKYKNFYQTLK